MDKEPQKQEAPHPPAEHSTDFTRNMQYLLLYSMSYVLALGINELVNTIFDRLSFKSNVISKSVYVVSVFALTLLFIYLFRANLSGGMSLN